MQYRKEQNTICHHLSRSSQYRSAHYRKIQESITQNRKNKEESKLKQEVIELKPFMAKTAEVTIVGDGDLVLNKMNDVTVRNLTQERKGKAKDTERPNKWEEIITSIHWFYGKPNDFSEESFKNALKNNAPCITAFGLKKSFGDAVVRNEIDKYKTKFDTSVNVIAEKGLVPITFTGQYIDERLMSPKKGSPVLARLNHFTGWRATFTVSYTENVYSLEQIINIINLAGFGLGIGSGRSSGYGRYHVESIS